MNAERLESRTLLAGNLPAEIGEVYPIDSVNLGEVTYFSASDGAHGRELWRSDGTARGTVLVRDILPGAAGADPEAFAVLGNREIVFLSSNRDGTRSLWRSDGTKKGTREVRNLGKITVEGLVGYPLGTRPIVGMGGRAVFIAYGQTDGQPKLWTTDGTAAGTVIIGKGPSLIFGPPVLINGVAVYKGLATGSGTETSFLELWRTDGTDGGTSLLMQTRGGTNSLFSKGGGRLYFENLKPSGEGDIVLWTTDGTIKGTRQLAEYEGGAGGQMVELPDGRLMFSISRFANQRETWQLWTSDGTTKGTAPFTARADGATWQGFSPIGGLFYFFVYHSNGRSDAPLELWRTDGTSSGTAFVEDLGPKGITQRSRVELFDDKLVITPAGKPPVIVDPQASEPPSGPTRGRLKLYERVLCVYGTRNDDSIRIQRHADDPSRFIVDLNGIKRSFASGDVRKLVIYGYEGNDTIVFNESRGPILLRTRIRAGAGNDTIHGNSTRDTILAEDGDDLVITGLANDFVLGGAGNDTIITGAGDDTLIGGVGDDQLSSGRDHDFLSAGNDPAGADSLDGGDDADLLFGRAQTAIFHNGDEGADPLGIDDLLKP